MAMTFERVVLAGALSVMLASCGGVAQLPVSAGMGPSPALPEPEHALLPTVNVARATGWPAGGAPTAAPGLAVNAFSVGLRHPRWVYVLPNGDVLVAESNAPVRPDEGGGVRGFFMQLFMGYAGAGAESANRITLLRDTNGDGVADVRTVFVDQLNSPFGMALIGTDFYVANTDAVVRYHYTPGATSLTGPGTKVVDLPAGTRNHHWTKNLIASPDGRKLYVTVGSNSNVGENGMEIEAGRAAIWEVDVATGEHRIFASGLRNPNGLAWVPPGNALWTAVNERDELGSDLVPDYMTAVQDGAFYGWPYSYYGQHVDERVQPPRPDLVAQARVPDYALGSHTASLGLAWSGGLDWPAPFATGLLVGQHGSWNRKPRSGYQVVFVPFAGEQPQGLPLPVLTGFVNADGEALGRPVGVAVDAHGGLLVADDVGNVIWRVTRAPH